MVNLKWTAIWLMLLCSPSYAKDLLDVALDRKSVAFVVDKTRPLIPMGATVEFMFRDGGVPKKIPYTNGFVLGTQNNVTFIELSNRGAAEIARYRAKGDVHYQKTSDPDPETVSLRREGADRGAAIRLAPRMRRLTIRMDLDNELVSSWSPGELIAFSVPRGGLRHVMANRDPTPDMGYRDVDVMLHSATETENGQFDLMVVAHSYDADLIIRAELQDRLKIGGQAGPLLEGVIEPRCSITQRNGSERIEVRIPCRN